MTVVEAEKGMIALLIVLILAVELAIAGFIAGGVTAKIGRRPWVLKSGLLDAVLAAVVGIVALVVEVEIASAVGLYYSISFPWRSFAVALACVVARHLMRPRTSRRDAEAK